MSRSPSKASEDLLLRAIRSSHCERRAIDLFDAHPNLRRIACSYCWYVSPLCDRIGAPLDITIAAAIDGFIDAKGSNYKERLSYFVGALLASCDALAKWRILVMALDDTWEIWQHDVPLMLLLRRHKRDNLRFRRRDKSISQSSIAIKMLSYICTQSELQLIEEAKAIILSSPKEHKLSK